MAWLFFAEIGRFVFFFCSDLLAGLHVLKTAGRFAIFALSQLPEHTGDGVFIIDERDRTAGQCGRPALIVGVIELRCADAHGDICKPAAIVLGVEDRALAASNGQRITVIDRVTDEIRRRVGFCQLGAASVQLRLHGIKHHL